MYGITLATLSFLSILACSGAWRQWNYSVNWWADAAGVSDSAKVAGKKLQWENEWATLVWGSGKSELGTIPRPRRGHSMVIVQTAAESVLFKGATYIVMFGGRDLDSTYMHIPKTFNVVTVNGTLEFTTYDEKPVNPCSDTKGKYYSAAERAGCENVTSTIDIGVIYNDVWAYKLCPIGNSTNVNETEAKRFFDGPCEGSGWELWHPGALQGGCTIELGIEVCDVPSERYNHASVMFNDGAMYVYGGYSQRCSDYCDDMWFFDIYMQVQLTVCNICS